MDRRGFLRGIALGAVTTGSAIVLTPGNALAADGQPPAGGGYYAGTVYGEGTVVRRTAGRLTIVDPELGIQEITLSAKVTVWKGTDTVAGVIADGDHLSLRGYRLDDGTIDAVAIWVNIAWVRGMVTAVNGSAVMVAAGDGSPATFGVAAHTTLHLTDTPAELFNGQLQAGQAVEALGAFDRPGGVLQASRVWIA
jgi:hypothetical protein